MSYPVNAESVEKLTNKRHIKLLEILGLPGSVVVLAPILAKVLQES